MIRLLSFQKKVALNRKHYCKQVYFGLVKLHDISVKSCKNQKTGLEPIILSIICDIKNMVRDD